MFEVASIGMAQSDPNTGQWVRVNQKMCKITGYSTEELLQMKVPEITHPDDRERDWELFQRVVRSEAPDYRLEKRYMCKDVSADFLPVGIVTII
jgi:PAS domain S-box-containing protein